MKNTLFFIDAIFVIKIVGPVFEAVGVALPE